MYINILRNRLTKTKVNHYFIFKQYHNNIILQVTELHNILSKENAVMQSDGNFTVQNNSEEVENVIQISDDEENCCMQELKCKLCTYSHF